MNRVFILSFMCLSLFFASCSDDAHQYSNSTEYEEVVAIANRASGSVSFINADSDQVEQTLSINGSEPMYVVYVPKHDRLYVGDRALNQVHVINPNSRQVESSINVGQGVFHMWADGQGNQLWVNNDVDQTTSIINLNNNTVSNTISIGQKPHDVFVNDAATMAYVSVLVGDETVKDSIYAYNTTNLVRMASAAVGDDPHLFHIAATNTLYVPNQSGEMFLLDGTNLSEKSSIMLEGAHGIYPTPDNKDLFVTNLPGAQLFSFSTTTNALNGSPLNTEVPVPHNITVNETGSKAYVTHSGPMANRVSIYNIDNGNLTLKSMVTVQNNPFGLAYYKREIN